MNEWKKLRENLINDKDQKTEDKLLKINSFWWNCPFINYSLDFEKPEDWPTPWELIFENQYDHVGRSYMIAETLLMVDIFDKKFIELILIKDVVENNFKMVVKADNYILGYSNNEIFHYNDFFKMGHIILLKYEKCENKWKINEKL